MTLPEFDPATMCIRVQYAITELPVMVLCIYIDLRHIKDTLTLDMYS